MRFMAQLTMGGVLLPMSVPVWRAVLALLMMSTRSLTLTFAFSCPVPTAASYCCASALTRFMISALLVFFAARSSAAEASATIPPPVCREYLAYACSA